MNQKIYLYIWKKIPIQISNHDDKCIDCYAVKNTKNDNIPMFLKKQKYINTNKEIKHCCHNNKSFQIKSNLIPLNNELKIINSLFGHQSELALEMY